MIQFLVTAQASGVILEVERPVKGSPPALAQTVADNPNGYFVNGELKCRSGYRLKSGNCVDLFEETGGVQPSNSYVSGNDWHCNVGYVKVGAVCQPVQEFPAPVRTVTSTGAGTAVVLPPQELFKKLKDSIWVVYSVAPGGKDSTVSLGSAVAVGPETFLTNCHVIQTGGQVYLKQDKTIVEAKEFRSDTKADRCVVRTTGTGALPISGIRSFDSVEIGEVVYSLGAPSGLELTFGDGIISGKRRYEGRRYIQTTAPISPGSSGGGLFDRSGNLVGITTFLLKDSQSLNFAIPAEDFSIGKN